MLRETVFTPNLIASKVKYKIKSIFELEALKQPRAFQQCNGTAYAHI